MGGSCRFRARSSHHSSISIPRSRVMPSSARSFGISSTSAGGPQMKHSVAGSWTSSRERVAVRCVRARRSSRRRPSRVTVCRSSIRPLARQRAQFVLVRELVRRARAVEQADVAVRQVQRVPQHRAQRRDAGAAGDEHEPALVGSGGKRERAERAFDVDERARLERQVRARRAVGVDADEQLERSRRAARPPAPRRSSTAAASRGRGVAIEHRLARRVVERAGRPGRAARCARAASPAAPRGWAA